MKRIDIQQFEGLKDILKDEKCALLTSGKEDLFALVDLDTFENMNNIYQTFKKPKVEAGIHVVGEFKDISEEEFEKIKEDVLKALEQAFKVKKAS